MIRSLSDIINSAVAFITGKRPDIATFEGTVVRDVVIESPAQEFNNVYTELTHTQQLQSVDYAANMSTAELDALGDNYALTRLSGTSAVGLITFQIRNFTPTSTTVTVPVGTVVATKSSATIPQVSFT